MCQETENCLNILARSSKVAYNSDNDPRFKIPEKEICQCLLLIVIYREKMEENSNFVSSTEDEDYIVFVEIDLSFNNFNDEKKVAKKTIFKR